MSSTIRVEESVQIAKPPAEVWEAIADYAFDLEWRKGLLEMRPDPPGPPASGTRVHEVVRNSGREYVADTVVTALDPGVSYRFAGTGTIGGLSGGRAVRADAPGTGAVFTYTIELQPKGGMRLLGPLLGPLVRSGLKKDLQKLRTLLENHRYEVTPIGTVESPLTDPASAPNQGDEGAPDAWLAFEPAVLDALDGIRAGDEVIVLTWLDRARRDVLRVHPRGDMSREQQGVFNTRSPDRPNPIGLHRVRVASIDGGRVRVHNLEAVDGTPIVDVKPVLSSDISER